MEDQNTASHADRVTHNLHRSRAREYLTSQIAAAAVAMGAVWLGRNIAPKAMQKADKAIADYLAPHMHGESAAYIQNYARRTLNYTTMLTGGLMTTVTGQTIQARRRRSGKEHADDITISRDITRVLTGWSIGAFGAVAALNIAERYGRKGSAKAVTDILDRAEKMLDTHLLHGAEYVKGNKISEGLVANAVMVAGATPVSIAAQQLYDSLRSHPAYEKIER